MTSASELFYNRRSRLSRISSDVGFDSNPELNLHQNNNNRRRHHLNNNNHRSSNRHDLDGCDPLRRSTHLRHPCHRLSHADREPVRVNQVTSQRGSGNHVVTETLSSTSNRPRVTRNDRLPGAVLMARERLLQRLRGVSVSERRSHRDTFSRNQNDNALSDDFRLADAGDWETELLSEFSARGIGTSSSDSTSEIDQLTFLSKPIKKPPGLTQDALNCLDMEVFSGTESAVKATDSTESWDCSICLESFEAGDLLVRLLCSHRFHFACLDPWVRTCGDCPYCRRGIL